MPIGSSEPDWRTILARLREDTSYGRLAAQMRARGYDVTEDQLKDVGRGRIQSPRWSVGAGILDLHRQRVREATAENAAKSTDDIAAP